ncbi:O-acetyl-ADP-ribose deacetylase (regulator of RNase III), contains Macro domain [Catalinimonas alkaloidigena]|uniref:O-acetyl-ADP-ribose deacetylase (Regulator of RNase III), contains Macro domain n=1 Tax=Catalinimonas alkaloidigena TaxID=1075417 RepID=A0A1G9NFC1_9BACT|nr:O-acetyl-ADP-ribose deacetylase [Catalinimonas alkaloidigena]SDL85258.1 O-acetyl-ADP-ribose deacetylase (regulator of RNase III), contains Macro domain [Catalinimonas alkaloidigena]
MDIRVEKGDITKMEVDAIVNAANSSLRGGGGVDGAIHRAGGPAIMADLDKIRARQGGCGVGEAVITGGGRLPAQHVIHTVGPVWNGGHKGEPEKLAQAYRNSLRLAAEHGARTVAIPNISTGIYGYPKREAAEVALQEVKAFGENPGPVETVIFVCFDEENYQLYQQALA